MAETLAPGFDPTVSISASDKAALAAELVQNHIRATGRDWSKMVDKCLRHLDGDRKTIHEAIVTFLLELDALEN